MSSDQFLVRQKRLLVGGQGFFVLDVGQLLLPAHQGLASLAQLLHLADLSANQGILLLEDRVLLTGLV
ncbi:hypothetical protein D3C76_1621660 [compost metagenome]